MNDKRITAGCNYGGIIILGFLLLFTKLSIVGGIFIVFGVIKILGFSSQKNKSVKDELRFFYEREIQNGKSDIEALSIAAYAWNPCSRLSKALEEIRVQNILIENAKRSNEIDKGFNEVMCKAFGNCKGLDRVNEFDDISTKVNIKMFQRRIDNNMKIVDEERKLLNI